MTGQFKTWGQWEYLWIRILIESNLSQNLWSAIHITFQKPYPWHFSEGGTFSVHPGSSFLWGNRCGWGQLWHRPCTYRRWRRGCGNPWWAFQGPLERLLRFRLLQDETSTNQALPGRRQEYLCDTVLLVMYNGQNCNHYHRGGECGNNVKQCWGADYAESLTGAPRPYTWFSALLFQSLLFLSNHYHSYQIIIIHIKSS